MDEEKRIEATISNEKKLLESYTEEVAKFLDSAGNYHVSMIETLDHAKVIMEYLEKTGNAPSVYFKENAHLYKGWISEELLEDFYYSIDNVIYYQYSNSMDRRCMRYSGYENNIGKIARIIDDYHDDSLYETKDLNKPWCFNSYLIAAEIDKGNEGLIEYIERQIFDDGGKLSYYLIHGIMLSKSTRLYEALGKLLLAARLQEGLRQSICELMDSGRHEAFMYFYELLIKNDLFRFSSVIRAGAVWTGLIADEYDKIDRISKKLFELCYTNLTDEAARQEALKSEDAMEIYLALWSIGAKDGRESALAARDLFNSGSAHQRLVAAYYLLAMVSYDEFFVEAVKKHNDELPLMAIIMDKLRLYSGSAIFRATGSTYDYYKDKTRKDYPVIKRTYATPERFLGDPAEYALLYDRLYELYERLPKKKTDFSPCVFPWNSARLEKGAPLVVMAYIASILHSNELGDKVLSHLSDIGVHRGAVLELLAAEPETPFQRETVISMVTSPDHETRVVAFHILNTMEISNDEYRELENHLRLKNADMRNTLLSFLYDLGGQDMEDMIKRLLADKGEEKRLGALSLIKMLKDDEGRRAEYEAALEHLDLIADRTDNEQVIINDITEGTSKSDCAGSEKELLYDKDATYEPVLDLDWIKECEKRYAALFPGYDSGNNDKNAGLKDLLRSLDNIVHEHRNDEFTKYSGETVLFCHMNGLDYYEDDERKTALEDIWDEFFKKTLSGDYSLVYKLLLMLTPYDEDDKGYEDFCEERLKGLIGEFAFENISLNYLYTVRMVLEFLEEKYRDLPVLTDIAVTTCHYLATRHKDDLVLHFKRGSYWDKEEHDVQRSVMSHPKLEMIATAFEENEDEFERLFPIRCDISEKAQLDDEGSHGAFVNYSFRQTFKSPSIQEYLRACERGIISRQFLEKVLWGWYPGHSTEVISEYVKKLREKGRAMASRGYSYNFNNPERDLFYKNTEKYKDRNENLARMVNEAYDKIAPRVVESEIKRGDVSGELSFCAMRMCRVYGAENFAKILTALGKQKLDRSMYYSISREKDPSRNQSLSHLLFVCVPGQDETVEDLRSALAGRKITEKRLVEAALYCPEWISLIEEYLGWEGFSSCCYYFIAHTNETISDKNLAMIAKYSPLTKDELFGGAFDSQWFKEVYETIGAERFDMVYDAAKYISNGAKHTRARKYADAALDKLDMNAVMEEIESKRNKDYLMSLGCIPSKSHEDLINRYLFIQKFEKQSRSFGAQRRASEKLCSEMAVKNMATTNGYQDEMRFILLMESGVSEGLLSFFEPKVIDGETDTVVSLEIDDNGKVAVNCTKAGKKLKSIPSAYKKNEYVAEMTEAKKTLAGQASRARTMFENAMEEELVFSLGELRSLSKSPVIKPIIEALVLKDGDEFGFLREFEGKKGDENVIIAHPFHLYSAGVWRSFQQRIFDLELVQPFKQVFRELYVKTDDEKEQLLDTRFAGNQIQPKKTLAVLKTRRWVCDMYEGLQKVYYKKNLIATMYALADWFSPADIECPTLEYVSFTDRKSFKDVRVKDVPDILFSEVMRDVDLAVSVAHAGGVDPEFSHSTLEMRKAIAEFTLPMFKLDNVTFTATHALIKGSRASYTIHLGSGVIHRQGGPMINVLPVHSQHRGRIFLPFVDDDPKTSEVISKILLFARDEKIKDPFILEQLG